MKNWSGSILILLILIAITLGYTFYTTVRLSISIAEVRTLMEEMVKVKVELVSALEELSSCEATVFKMDEDRRKTGDCDRQLVKYVNEVLKAKR